MYFIFCKKKNSRLVVLYPHCIVVLSLCGGRKIQHTKWKTHAIVSSTISFYLCFSHCLLKFRIYTLKAKKRGSADRFSSRLSFLFFLSHFTRIALSCIFPTNYTRIQVLFYSSAWVAKSRCFFAALPLPFSCALSPLFCLYFLGRSCETVSRHCINVRELDENGEREESTL